MDTENITVAEVKTETKAKAKVKRSGDDLVEYYAPLVANGRDDNIFCAVNGETLRILRGEQVQIKRKFYEVLRASEAQDLAAARARKKMQQKMQQMQQK